jgi:hypothetical protein
MPLYPVSFSIHESKIIDRVPEKTKLLGTVIPGVLSTYVYTTEKEYYNDYQTSWFGITHKKGGWDCMRHYEILANGCIPLFRDIHMCPKATMTHLPKELIQHGLMLYEKMQINDNDTTRHECKELIKQLLDYTRTNLTNYKLAQYILSTCGHSNVKRILYLSGNTSPDYLRCVTLVGFKQLLGKECHDYPSIKHIYKDCVGTNKLYGKGISYTNIVDTDLHCDKYDKTVTSDIINHTYDIIIYGSYTRGIPFWKEVTANYKPSEIILIHGEDEPINVDSKLLCYHIFAREIISM